MVGAPKVGGQGPVADDLGCQRDRVGELRAAGLARAARMARAPQIVGWPSIFRQPLAVILIGLVQAILGVRAADLLAGGRIATIAWTSEGVRVTGKWLTKG
jgi:hypothetical protein